ncbi:MAG: M1 family metallopeptidase [Microthrixaceae bacterium]|nr:M1 family metallopeptidase [Microthrixaceae bacterium]
MSQDPFRLPTNVVPRHYQLEIRPDLAAATFDGEVEITVEVTEATDRIVLNALDLDLRDVAANGTGATDLKWDTETERVTVVLPAPLPVGKASLTMAFSGVLNDKLMGFYRSTFELPDPETGEPQQHSIAVTQFESTHARAAFPCFDEPSLKATFKISLVIDENLFAVSNGAELSRTPAGPGLARVDFAETMVMSTYLVAFVVGPLVATEPRMVAGSNGPIPLRVIHTPGSEHLCGFALDVAEAALRYFENYYEIPYPGDKVDLVAVPDFAFGAMENLGCVTFREVLLLIDPDEATQPELQRVADVINHELAHMWFGDLVTMNWWNGIWLNEAFATFMEIKASESFRPQWDVWTNFGLARAAAFDTDALLSTRPIEYPVISPADSEGMFDILTYEKGASVVRMLEQHLGEETFRRGIAAYLADHAYGVTETTDLWDSLEAVSSQPVRKIMDGWIFRGGHPSVTVTPTERGVRLEQQRFAYASGRSDDASATTPDDRWLIPMSVRTQVDEPADGNNDATFATHNLLLDDDVELDLGGRPSLVQVNTNGNGFFRTNLDPALRAALATDTSASALERFMLIDDTFAALNAGRVDLDEAWDLLARVGETETEPAVWRRIAAGARELYRLGAPHRSEHDTALVIGLTDPGLSRVKETIMTVASGAPRTEGPDNSADALTQAQEIRGIIAPLRGTIGADEHVREHVRMIFDMGPVDATQPPYVDASLRAAAIEVIGYTASVAEHEELRNRWRGATTPQDELRYLTALVDTDNPELLSLTLNLTLTEVRTQNAPYLLGRAIAHRSLGETVWAFVMNNWETITDRFPSNSLPRMLSGIRSVTSGSLAQQIESDLAGIELPSGQQQLEQHLERMWVSVGSSERT